MDDLISRQALCEYALNQKDKSITPNDIMRFPSAQSTMGQVFDGDTINRQAAISHVDDVPYIKEHPNVGLLWKAWIESLPSAQPETHEERTETHACDYINRKDAIEAHYEYCNKHPDAGFPVWSLKILDELPSAQPKIIRCKECKYNSNTCGNYVNCDIIPQMFGRTTDNFCSRAERRTDDS